MQLNISPSEAAWFLPLVAPICLWVIWSDLSRMKITNRSNLALLVVFVVLGLIVLPLGEYGWRLAQVGIVLCLTFLANAIGLMGAGDSKFLAAAAAFVAPGDAVNILMLLAGVSICAFAVHRGARNSPLRRLAPEWESWANTEKFPMGFALGSTMILYLSLGLFYGS